ncbi:hypothetical protein GW17_00023555 [Ensete ventricosum]|nr:hypothetical protein GW17_00023555 [Ensete ventricosum]
MRKREKKNETSAIGEPRDDATDEENLVMRELLRCGLHLITTRKIGGLDNVAKTICSIKVGWLSSSYDSTLATKLDGTQGRSYIPVFQIRMEKMKEVKRSPL